MNLDQFFKRKYGANYNCAAFVVEVWKHITGNDIDDVLLHKLRESDLPSVARVRRRFRLLEKPSKLCIAMMQGVRDAAHVGIVIDGRVFHIRRDYVEFQPIEVAAAGYTRVRYYEP